MESLTVHTADELVTRWEKRAESLLPTPGHTLAGSYDLGQGHAYRMAATELRAILNEARRDPTWRAAEARIDRATMDEKWPA